MLILDEETLQMTNIEEIFSSYYFLKTKVMFSLKYSN